MIEMFNFVALRSKKLFIYIYRQTQNPLSRPKLEKFSLIKKFLINFKCMMGLSNPENVLF